MKQEVKKIAWERYNSPIGEHIWEGKKHIASIAGDGQYEVARLVVETHNCQLFVPELPKFKSEDEERDFWGTHDSTDYADTATPVILEYTPKPDSILSEKVLKELSDG